MANALFRVPEPTNEPVKTYAPGTPERALLKQTLERYSKTTTEIPLVIGGEPGSGKETFDVTSPQDKNKVIARCQAANAEDVSAAIQSCLDNRAAWAALPWQERAAVFLKAADLIATKYRPHINAATMLGQGKTAHQAEIDAACELIDFLRFNVKFATEIYAEQPSSSASMWNRSEARGLEGFVFAVTPFNFTAIAVNLPTSAALMGCTVLWKPAQTSMLACHIALNVLREAGLPDGVINMVAGNHQIIGDAVLKHPELAGIHFTGSTPTFNYFWKTVGNNIDRYNTYPRIVGETGGKDFVFAHPSADVDQLVTALVRGAFEYQGQKCSAASRAYIPRSLWPQVREKLVALTNELKMGDPADFSNFVGAVIDQRSYTKITEYIDHAKASSEATVIAGGEYSDEKGYFVRPTVIEATNPKYRSMVEEIFGPVLTVYPYADEQFEQTLDLCDRSTRYALTGAIFARDRHTIYHMTKRLEHAAGNFYINDKPTGAVVGQQPFGGSRASGTNDKAGSKLNLLRWTSMRTIKENFVPITDYRYPYMGEE